MCSGITFFSQYVRKIKTSCSSQSGFIFTFPRVCFLPLQKKNNMHLPALIWVLFFQTNKHICLRTSRREKLFSTTTLPTTLPNAGTPLSALSTKRLLISMTERDTNEWGWLRGPLGRLRVCLSTSGAIAADHSLPHCRGSPAGLSSDGYSGSDSFGGRARTHANGSLHTK